MQELITDNRQLRIYAIILLMAVLSSCAGCVSKANSLSVQEQVSYPVLGIPFVDILDNYFAHGDTSRFVECIGKIVIYEEMRKVSEKYATGGYFVTFLERRNDVTSGKSILYKSQGIRRPDGLTDFLILDITSIEGRSGYYLAPDYLYELPPAYLFEGDSEGNVNDYRYYSTVPNYVGVIEYKFSDGLVFDTRIIPKWIVTANEEGKIIITEPTDDKWFVYFSSEPEFVDIPER